MVVVGHLNMNLNSTSKFLRRSRRRGSEWRGPESAGCYGSGPKALEMVEDMLREELFVGQLCEKGKPKQILMVHCDDGKVEKDGVIKTNIVTLINPCRSSREKYATPRALHAPGKPATIGQT
jgi:hypothetical protein